MNYFLKLDVISFYLLVVFAISLVIQLFYYLFFYLRIAFYKEKSVEKPEKQPLSVIICAKNEAS
ncbi:MAG: hypothetical protein P1P88_03460, partial [Bacteroidales bacterium]|nr:hypothetical protein [Bacteroidales bacterium]